VAEHCSEPDLDALVVRAGAGDEQALATAFEACRDRLERMVRARLDPMLQGRLQVDDVLQEAYIEAARRFSEFFKDRKAPFFLWLRSITGQKLLEIHRRHGAQKRDVRREVHIRGSDGLEASSAVLAQAFAASQTSPSSVVARDEICRRLESALEDLDPTDREVLVLRYYERLSNLEAAEVLGITPNATSQRHFRALKRLRGLMGDALGLSGP
jgi:RNA polymerase sigma-70 factor (ECF subfamily)